MASRDPPIQFFDSSLNSRAAIDDRSDKPSARHALCGM
jgi:hypothetical protein